MDKFSIIPVLGLKTSVSQNDPTLLSMVGDNIALTHTVDAINVDYRRIKNACSKAKGKVVYSNSAISSATGCQGLFMLDDGTNVNLFIFDHGNVYHLDNSLDPEELTDDGDSGSPGFASAVTTRFSCVRYGDYIIFTDSAQTHSPYRWKHGDGTDGLALLLQTGTAYKFKYLEVYQGRIIGAYSDQTNGDIEIRWTDRLPTIGAGTDMDSANQLYKPDDDSIAGIKRMGRNACFLYGDNSIDRLDYYANYSTPFGLTNMVANQGCASHHSIVDVGGRHFLFNKDYGFCEYAGTNQFPHGGKPISEPIDNIIAGINPSSYGLIVGAFVPASREIAWTVPLYGATTPTHILYYNIQDGTWRLEDKAVQYVDIWDLTDNYTWEDLIADLGNPAATWSDIPSVNTWSTYSSSRTRYVFCGTDGKVYYYGGENLAGSALDGYRVEPILDFGSAEDKDLLLEIWMDIVHKGDWSIDLYHRGADNENEVENTAWTSLGSISCNGDADPVIYTNKMYRFHQIKWRNENADERFAVNKIEFRYVRQGRY